MFFFPRNVSESETSLLQRATEWPGHPTLESLTPDALRKITKEQGIDFATALLFDRFQKSANHRGFIKQIDSLRHDAPVNPPALDAKVVIVPGALYRERPDMGGDGRLVRELAMSFGYETDLIPLASFGSVTENARLIGDWFHQQPPRKIILVSLSKGGADLKMALAAPDAPDVYRHVIAWVNVCGPLNGTGIANWILASRLRTFLVRAKCRWQRRDFQLIADLRHDSGGLLAPAPVLLPSVRMLSLIGFPLKQHFTTPFSRFCHRTLAADGPNDGTTSLADLRSWPGDIYPAWGMDHYFRPEAEAKKLVTTIFQNLNSESAEKTGGLE